MVDANISKAFKKIWVFGRNLYISAMHYYGVGIYILQKEITFIHICKSVSFVSQYKEKLNIIKTLLIILQINIQFTKLTFCNRKYTS